MYNEHHALTCNHSPYNTGFQLYGTLISKRVVIVPIIQGFSYMVHQ